MGAPTRCVVSCTRCLGFSRPSDRCPGRFAAHVRAWPSPSGPLGRQRLRGQGWALAPIALATRPKGAPLTLEGPTRTMRGVPVPTGACAPFIRRPVHLAHGDRPGQLAQRVIHGALRRVLTAAGPGHRRGGQRPATVRYRARGSGPGCPATCGESPHHPWPSRRGTLRSFTFSVLVLRIHRESRPGPVGLARRRCALDDREESPHSPRSSCAVELRDGGTK
jgi:hypothetical protein